MVSALVQPLHLLLGVVVSSHHAQQLHESNKKKPVVVQARIGMLVRWRCDQILCSSFSSSSASCCWRKTRAATAAFQSFSGIQRVTAIDSLVVAVGWGRDFHSVVAALLAVAQSGQWISKHLVVAAMFKRFTKKAIKVIMLYRRKCCSWGTTFLAWSRFSWAYQWLHWYCCKGFEVHGCKLERCTHWGRKDYWMRKQIHGCRDSLHPSG